MGVYIEFWRGSPDGIEGHLRRRLPKFREWYEAELAPGPDAGFSQDVSRLLAAIVGGATPPTVRNRNDAVAVDHLVSDFYGQYCDTVASAELEGIRGSNLHARHYENIQPWVEQSFGPPVARAWGHIVRGRGIWRGETDVPFVSPDGVFHIGYLTLDECRIMSPSLLSAPAVPGTDSEEQAFRCFSDAVELAAQSGHGLIVTRA
jgi:hypothetical protein